MLKLPKACFTAFEDAVGELNILNVRFRLVMSLLKMALATMMLRSLSCMIYWRSTSG